jgi:hypothetical protein
MNSYIKTHWEIFIILLAVLTPLLWFDDGYFITGADLDQTLFPVERFLHRLQTWDSHFLGGTDRSNNVTSLVFIGVQALFSIFGLSAIDVEKYTMCFWMANMAVGMYFLLSILIPIFNLQNKFAESIARLAGVLFFIWNFYNNFMWLRLQLCVSTAAMLPVLLGVIFGLYLGKLSISKAIIITVIASILGAATGLQPPIIYAFLIMLSIIFIYLWNYPISQNPEHKAELIRAFILVGIVWFVSSCFWILPLFSFIYSSGYLDSGVGISNYETTKLLAWVSQSTSFANIFRSLGDIPWWDGWGGEPYWIEFDSLLGFGWLQLATYLQFFLLISSLFYKTTIQAKKLIHLIFIILLCSLFLSKGTHEPFGDLFNWMVENLPGFWIHRAPWQKFGMITSICFSLIFAFSIGHGYRLFEYTLNIKKPILFDKKNKFYLQLLILLLLLGFLISTNWLFISGKFLPNNRTSEGFHGKYNLGFHHQIPDYIFQVKEFINADKSDFKVLQFPDAKSTIFNWGYGGSADISFNIFDKGIISRQYGEGMSPPNTVDQVQDIIARAVLESEPLVALKLMGLLNIKYVLQRNDIAFDFYGPGFSPSAMKEKLTALDGLKLVATFGKWDVYQLSDRYRIPKIYIAQYQTSFEKPSSFVPKKETSSARMFIAGAISKNLDSTQVFHSAKSFFEPNDKGSLNQFSFQYLDYKKINETSYLIKIKGLQGNQKLVFQESFHPFWKLYAISEKTLSQNYNLHFNSSGEYPSNDQNVNLFNLSFFNLIQKNTTITLQKIIGLVDVISIGDNDHYLSNSYSNGWEINIDKICERESYCLYKANSEMEVYFVVEFIPQTVLHIGFIISLFSFIICLLFLFFHIVKVIRVQFFK